MSSRPKAATVSSTARRAFAICVRSPCKAIAVPPPPMTPSAASRAPSIEWEAWNATVAPPPAPPPPPAGGGGRGARPPPPPAGGAPPPPPPHPPPRPRRRAPPAPPVNRSVLPSLPPAVVSSQLSTEVLRAVLLATDY